MTTPFEPARTIDEVIQRLDLIIEESIQSTNPVGMFPALYVVVTEKVKEGIRDGRFEKGERMEKLDVIFANRYLEAYHHCFHGQPLTRSWNVALHASQTNPSMLILQHLLLGMNAHINLDLGIAAAEVAPGDQLADLENDFNMINKILAELTGLVKDEIGHLSPRIALVDRWLRNADDALVNFSMQRARRDAWKFAQELAYADEAEWEKRVDKKDIWVADLAEKIQAPGFWPQLVVWWIRRKESRDFPAIIEGLRNVAGEMAAKISFSLE